MPQKFFDSVKSSNFCVPLKPSFVWFKTEHGESGESKAVTSIPERKLWLSQSGLLLCGRDPFNQNFRKFQSKTEWIGSVQPEKFRKNQSTFRGGPLFSVGPVRSKWTVPFDHSDPFSIPVPRCSVFSMSNMAEN